MKNISFAWTTPALLAGHKTVTRRDWSPEYAERFREGEMIAACDKQPRFGGKKVAEFALTLRPYFESTADAPAADYVAEGFQYLQERNIKVDGFLPETLWRIWHLAPRGLWVVRFELVEVL